MTIFLPKRRAKGRNCWWGDRLHQLSDSGIGSPAFGSVGNRQSPTTPGQLTEDSFWDSKAVFSGEKIQQLFVDTLGIFRKFVDILNVWMFVDSLKV